MSVDPALHGRWRAVARHFPGWTFAFDVIFNPGTYRFLGSDLIAAMRVDPRVKRAFAGLDDTPLSPLATMAAVNARRADDAFKAPSAS